MAPERFIESRRISNRTALGTTQDGWMGYIYILKSNAFVTRILSRENQKARERDTRKGWYYDVMKNYNS